MSGSSKYHSVLEASFASWYDRGRDAWSSEQAMRGAARYLLAQLAPGVPHHVLDIGTGRGRDVELFLEAGHRSTGVDVVELEDWAALRARWGDRVTLIKCAFQELQTDQRFTAALDVGCLHHQEPSDYPAYLVKLHTLLVPGAPCVFSVFTPNDTQAERGDVLTLPDRRINRELTEREMQTCLSAAGFTWREAHRWPRDKIEGCYLVILCERA